MDYFVLQDLGYEGIVVTRFDTLPKARKYYEEEVKEDKIYNTLYQLKDSGNKISIVLIQGSIVEKHNFELEYSELNTRN